MLRDSARRFFERECVPHEMRWRAQQHADRDIWNRAGQAGILCASIPDEYGGGGGSFLHEAVICEEQMRAMAQGFSNNVHSGIVAHYLLPTAPRNRSAAGCHAWPVANWWRPSR